MGWASGMSGLTATKYGIDESTIVIIQDVAMSVVNSASALTMSADSITSAIDSLDVATGAMVVLSSTATTITRRLLLDESVDLTTEARVKGTKGIWRIRLYLVNCWGKGYRESWVAISNSFMHNGIGNGIVGTLPSQRVEL